MACTQARQMALARAQFASLMVTGLPQGPRHSSYRDKVVMSPAISIASRPPIQQSRLTRDQQIQKKVVEIQSRSTPLHPICMKCGEKRHKAHDCRNARICFIYNKLGHKGAFCDTVTSPSPHSRLSRGETNLFSEHIAMAPPRRVYPRARPPYRSYQRQQQDTGHSGVPMAVPAPIPATQVPPNHPFAGFRNPQTQSAPPHSQPPSGMAQTPPDRPVQRAQRSEQPRGRPVLPAPPPPPLVRDIHPSILMLNSTPESEDILRELQMSFLLYDIAGWGPEKVNESSVTPFPHFFG